MKSKFFVTAVRTISVLIVLGHCKDQVTFHIITISNLLYGVSDRKKMC